FYGSVPAVASSHASTVVSIDPNTTAVTELPIAVNDPRALAISADGQYLYIGCDGSHSVKRLNLYTGIVEQDIAMAVDSILGQYVAASIVALPNAPRSIA